MYIPSHFQQSDPAVLHEFIERHSFGLLISVLDEGLFATHIPFLLQRTAGASGHLVGHLARANPQWRELEGRDVLAVFSGPHAYVSPAWYEAQNVVPTWNYLAVHAQGPCRLIEDEDELAQLLCHTVGFYEQAMPNPWTIDPQSDFFRKVQRQVVGFRVEIRNLEGKWKLNQNHPLERRARAAGRLAEQPNPDAREIARLIQAQLPPGFSEPTGKPS